MNRTMFKEGDRVRMVFQPNDPDPVPSGTEGTVTRVTDVDWPGQSFTQLSVDWDGGRTLSVVIPPDVVSFA